MAFEFVAEALTNRRQQELLRQRVCIESDNGALISSEGQHYLNFSGNDYLGMRQSLPVLQAFARGLSEFGAGSGASPLVTGYLRPHQALENYLAEALNREAVLLFNSGFAANQAICQALIKPHVQVVADKLIHASFIDGMQHHSKQARRFRHNDMAHLSHLLKDVGDDVLIATEGVFSMDGDQPDWATLTSLTAASGGWLIVDDAHGLGVLGNNGFGSAEAFALSQAQVPILMGTFGKAVGSAGAFIAGSQSLIDYLINYARHYIYSTAMPAAQACATLESFKQISSGDCRARLHENIALFAHLAGQANLPVMSSQTAIQPVLVGDNARTLAFSHKLKSLGLWVSAMRSPTVPKTTERLRVTLSASHTADDIKALVDALRICFESVKT